MTVLLAMSARARDAAYTDLYSFIAAVLLLIGVLSFALFRKSVGAALTAGALGLLSGGVFQPWFAFFPPPVNRNTRLADPEYVVWQEDFRVVAIFWAVAFLTVIVVILRLRRRKEHVLPNI